MRILSPTAVVLTAALSVTIPAWPTGAASHDPAAPSQPAAHGRPPGRAAPDYVVDPGLRPLRTARPGARADHRRAANARPVGTSVYDVHVFGLSMPGAPHGTDAEESRRVIERVDEEFARETEGSIRFRFAGFEELAPPGTPLCGVDDIADRYAEQIDALSAGPGATDHTWVAVSPPGCSYAGQAFLGGPGVHMSGYWESRQAAPAPPADPDAVDELDVATLAHELGHNLGLRHAASLDPGVEPFAGDFEEYGDRTSTMGSLGETVRFNGIERTQLGVIDPERIEVVDRTRATYELTSLSSGNGTQVLVVPTGDTRGIFVEYRSAAGYAHDWPLDFVYPDWWERESPSSGVYVRMTPRAADRHDQPGLSALADAGFVIPPDPAEPYRQGLRAGEQVDLPGGTSVRVDAVSGPTATVTVTRPEDTTKPPSHGIDVCEWAADRQTCTYHQRVRLAFELHHDEHPDDSWTERAGMSVDGDTVAEFEASGKYPRAMETPDHYWEIELPEGAVYEVTWWIEDIFGNRREETRMVDAASEVAPPGPVRDLSVARRERRAVVLAWEPPAETDGQAVVDYRIKFSSGGAMTTYGDGRSARTQVRVRDLRPGTRYRFTVTARTSAGWGDSAAVRAATR